jgi:hypothetical protein
VRRLHGLFFQEGDSEGGFVGELGMFQVRDGEFRRVD